MVNWVSVLILPLAVAMGAELGRRRQEAAGKTYSFIPRWIHFALTSLMVAAVVLFFEAASVSLEDPSPSNLWILILSGTASQIILVAIAAGELRYAKKRLLDVEKKSARQ